MLREIGLHPQDFAQITGLSLGTVKRLKQGLPVSRASAQKALDMAQLLPKASKALEIKELKGVELKTLHQPRVERHAQWCQSKTKPKTFG
ncbi:MAG: hypothetical protein AAGJ34_00800 [Pseudomonadota bacterium]